jgi:hypothetical protein
MVGPMGTSQEVARNGGGRMNTTRAERKMH